MQFVCGVRYCLRAWSGTAYAHGASPRPYAMSGTDAACVVPPVPDNVDGPDGQRRKHHCRACG
eukprot:3287669-Rhodomonas_salina.1